MADVGKWIIQKALTEGGQGQIFLLSREDQRNESFVLKRLKNAANPQRLSRFQQEIDVGTEAS